MSTRDDLRAQIDQLPDDQLEHARQMLEFLINPPKPHPEIEKLRQRGQEYRRLVEQRFRETQEPGTIGGIGGGGGIGLNKRGRGSGHHSFTYCDGNAIVYQSMRYYAGQELECMERFSLVEHESKLLYELELSSGGRTIHHQEEFPCTCNAAPINPEADC